MRMVCWAVLIAGTMLLLYAAIAGNLVVVSMIDFINNKRPGKKMSKLLIGGGASLPIQGYRQLTGDGPLYRKLKMTYRLVAISLGLMLLGSIGGRIFRN